MSVDVKAFVTKRVKLMHRAPQAWASRREAFALQLLVMLELIEIQDSFNFMARVFGEPGTCAAQGLDERVDDNWARRLIETEFPWIEDL